MDSPRPIRLPVGAATPDHVLLDIVAAIDLVAAGAARRVVLSCLPGVEAVAGAALSYAQSMQVHFTIARHGEADPPSVVVGPVEA